VPSTKKTMNYYHWSKLEDGRPRVSESYVTSVSVDDAVAFSRDLPEPWFIYVAFHAAHFPMHLPPEEHFTQELPKYPTEGQLYRVMVEALDHEIGRLLDGMDPDVRDRTNVLFLGDNGSAPVGVLPPWPKSQTKGALTRGGVRVPFIMAGPSVAARGARTDALVNTTDLFATVLDLAGIDVPPPEDSVSFAPVLSDPEASTRRFAFAEHFSPNGMGPWDEHSVAIRDDRYKLVVRNGRPQAMYDLQQDKMERRNLLKVKPRGEAFQRFRQLKYALPEGIELAERPTAEEIRLSGFDPDARL
jgi:arylsulfatase A-like enzyme